MYTIRNMVDNTLITLGTDGYQIYGGDHFITYVNVKSFVVHLKLTLQVNYISVKKRSYLQYPKKKNSNPLKCSPFPLPVQLLKSNISKAEEKSQRLNLLWNAPLRSFRWSFSISKGDILLKNQQQDSATSKDSSRTRLSQSWGLILMCLAICFPSQG